MNKWFENSRWAADKNWRNKLRHQMLKNPNQFVITLKNNQYRTHFRQLKREKDPAQNNTNSAGSSNSNIVRQINSISNNRILNDTKTNNANTWNDKKRTTVYPLCDTSGKTNHSTEIFYFGANATKGRCSQKTTRTDSGPTKGHSEQFKWKCSRCSPKFRVKTPPLHFGTAYDRPEATKTSNFYQFSRLSGSNPRIHLHINTS